MTRTTMCVSLGFASRDTKGAVGPGLDLRNQQMFAGLADD